MNSYYPMSKLKQLQEWKGKWKMTSEERLYLIRLRVKTIRLNTKIGSRRIADEANAILLDDIEYHIDRLYELIAHLKEK